MVNFQTQLHAGVLLLLAVSPQPALAERPVPVRPKPSAHSTRLQAQTNPAKPEASEKKGKQTRKKHGSAVSKQPNGKSVPYAKSKHHHRRVDDIDDPVEVKRARARGRTTSQRPRRITEAVAEPRKPAPIVRADPKPALLSHVTAPVLDPGELVLHDDRVEPPARSAAPPEDMAGAVPDLLRPATHQQLAEEATQPIVLPGLYRNGRLVVPAPLKGSRDVLVHQNQMADDEGLSRIEDDAELIRLRNARLLVPLPQTASLHVNPGLPSGRRYARPWTVKFATDTARAFDARFHQPIQVNSAVRTVTYQLRLQRTNGNAASVEGDTASPHLTGQAIDIGKHGLSTAQIAWMRAFLLPLIHAGTIDVEEEFQQACFHISVYRSYAPPSPKRALRAEVAALHPTRSIPRSDE